LGSATAFAALLGRSALFELPSDTEEPARNFCDCSARRDEALLVQVWQARQRRCCTWTRRRGGGEARRTRRVPQRSPGMYKASRAWADGDFDADHGFAFEGGVGRSAH
jgi:hypothetical protein